MTLLASLQFDQIPTSPLYHNRVSIQNKRECNYWAKKDQNFTAYFFAFLRLANNNEFFLIIFCVHSGMVIKNTQVNIKSWNQKKSYWFGLRSICWQKVWRYKAHVEKKYIDPLQSNNKKEEIMWIHAVELHIDTKY